MWTNPGMFGDLALGAAPPAEDVAVQPVPVAVKGSPKKLRVEARELLNDPAASPEALGTRMSSKWSGSSRGDTAQGWEPSPGSSPGTDWGLKAMSGNPGMISEGLGDFLKQNQAVGWSPPGGVRMGADLTGGVPAGFALPQTNLTGFVTPGDRMQRAAPMFDKLLAQAQAASEQGRKSFETTGQIGVAQQRSLADLANAEVNQHRQQLDELKNSQDQQAELQLAKETALMYQSGRSAEEVAAYTKRRRAELATNQGRQPTPPRPYQVQLSPGQPTPVAVNPGQPNSTVAVNPGQPGADGRDPGSGRVVPPKSVGDAEAEAAAKLFGEDAVAVAGRIAKPTNKDGTPLADGLTKAQRLANTAVYLHGRPGVGDNAFANPDGSINKANIDTFLGFLRAEYGDQAVQEFINPSNASLLGQQMGSAVGGLSDAQVLSSKLRNATGNKPPQPGLLDKLGYIDPVKTMFTLGSSLIGRYGR